MIDPGRRGKKRDLRRGNNGDGYKPVRTYDRKHGRHRYYWIGKGCDCDLNHSSYENCCNAEHEFLAHYMGCGEWEVYGHDHAPAWARRQLNRVYRARCKAALSKAFREWDWDNYLPPLRAEDVDYDWF